MGTTAAAAPPGRFFCSTSNIAFADEESLKAHYRSDFHRYNLKRKVAGLQPVTNDWFEARRSKLVDRQEPEEERVWICPLSKKKFASEKTYAAYTHTKKYKELLKKSGGAAVEPIVTAKAQPKEPTQEELLAYHARGGAGGGKAPMERDGGDDDGWETASDEGEEGEAMEDEGGDVWDVRQCLFSNHKSKSLEDNLAYMFKKFGFFIHDIEYCTDVEGLLKYLGAKVSQANIPLNESALVEEGKCFGSMHAVQRYMVDKNMTRMLFDGNEDEYEEYYDYSSLYTTDEGGELMALDSAAAADADVNEGGELVIQGEGGREKILGTRDMARYYKQKYRREEGREGVLISSVVARYRSMGIQTMRKEEELKRLKHKRTSEWHDNKRGQRWIRDHIGLVITKVLPKGNGGI